MTGNQDLISSSKTKQPTQKEPQVLWPPASLPGTLAAQPAPHHQHPLFWGDSSPTGKPESWPHRSPIPGL